MKISKMFRIRNILLFCSIAIISIWVYLINYTISFPSPSKKEIFYPISIITQFQVISTIVLICVIAVFVVLLVYSKLLGTPWIVISVTFISGCGLILAGMWSMLLASDLTYYETISLNNNQYHLIRVWGGERWGFSSPVEAYTILECNENGFICKYYSTPYLKDAFFNEFDDNGTLVIYDNSIYLRVNRELISASKDMLRR